MVANAIFRMGATAVRQAASQHGAPSRSPVCSSVARPSTPHARVHATPPRRQVLFSNKASAAASAKYRLSSAVRVHAGASDAAYRCGRTRHKPCLAGPWPDFPAPAPLC